MKSNLILLFGKNGQLGSVLLKNLGNHNIKAFDYPEIDFDYPEKVMALVKSLKPGLIINAAAYTAVDQAEKDQEKAFNVNGFSVEALAITAKEIGAGLIHYSTDYVFDGKKGSLYNENDLPKPINVYGKSKLLGENKISKTGGSYLIFRLSWVYSLTHPSFVTKVLDWGRKNETLRIVDDQISSPTWANLVAETTVEIINRGVENWAQYFKSICGLYHLTGQGTLSRYDWAKTIIELNPNKQDQKVTTILPAQSSDFNTLAERPHFTGLDCTKLENSFNLKIPNWKKSLQEAMSSSVENL